MPALAVTRHPCNSAPGSGFTLLTRASLHEGFAQALNGQAHTFVQVFVRCDLLICIHEKNGHLELVVAEELVKGAFLAAPALPAQALYPVAVYRVGEVPGRCRKAHLHRKGIRGQGPCVVNDTVGKNRKRFSFAKKRFNEFFAL